MSILFISDLHLDEEHPQLLQNFLDFLQSQAIKAEALYILGDLFEVWIGDDEQSPLQQTVINALRQLTLTQIPVYFIHGNRDFLIGERFAKESGCIILPDPHRIELYGVPTLIMHGDSLCTADERYMQFRKQVRDPNYQLAFLQKPLAERKAIAHQMRSASKNYTRTAEETIMDAVQQDIARVMQEHEVKLLIHGHTHRPAIEYFTLNNIMRCRIVLGDWDWNQSALVCNRDSHRLTITGNIPNNKIN